MSNKYRLTPEECEERKRAHLDRTIKECGYEEIPQTEYKRLKRRDPKNVNGYTIRFRFKYYKLKPKVEEFNQDEIIKKITQKMKLDVLRSAKEYFDDCIKEVERDEYEERL